MTLRVHLETRKFQRRIAPGQEGVRVNPECDLAVVTDMSAIDPNASAFKPVADEEVRRIVAHAMAVKDWTECQLSVLRNTYPHWDVERIRDMAGEVWWTARIRHRATPELLVAGIFPYVEQSDPIALAATLAWQTYLFHQWQALTVPPL
jgi:hypothetical protein